MNPSNARHQLLTALIIFSPLALAFMPPYESYFKEKPQRSGSDELSAAAINSVHQKSKDELSACQSLVAEMEDSKNGLQDSVDSRDGVSVENINAANELIHLQRLYSEIQTLLESSNAKWLESQTEIDWLREALGKASAEVSQAEQARVDVEEKLVLFERQLSEEKEFSEKFVEESRRRMEAEYGKKIRWQKQRNWDLASTITYLEKQLSEKESQYEETKAELLTIRYELYKANERFRYLENNIYTEIPRVSVAHISAFLGEVKDLAQKNLPIDQLQSFLELVKTNVSPLWHSCVVYIKTNLRDNLPPDVVLYQDQVMSNSCEIFDLFFIFFRLQAAPASVVSISQVSRKNCTEAVICMELTVMIIGFVFLAQLVNYLFRSRNAIKINQRL